jgi:hypothetical protein
MKRHMTSPYEVNLMDELTLKGITQYYAFVQVCGSGYSRLLCLISFVHLGEAKSSLLKHAVLKASNQPVDHLLQLDSTSRVVG